MTSTIHFFVVGLSTRPTVRILSASVWRHRTTCNLMAAADARRSPHTHTSPACVCAWGHRPPLPKILFRPNCSLHPAASTHALLQFAYWSDSRRSNFCISFGSRQLGVSLFQSMSWLVQLAADPPTFSPVHPPPHFFCVRRLFLDRPWFIRSRRYASLFLLSLQKVFQTKFDAPSLPADSCRQFEFQKQQTNLLNLSISLKYTTWILRT